jgi:plasmid replication initiation protein
MSEIFNKNRNIIKVDNQLFLKEFELTLEEMRLILLTMAQINADDEDFKTYKIKIKDIEEKTGSLKKNTRVKAMAKRLLSKPIIIDDNIIVNWFSMIKILNGELEVRFDPALKPYLLKLKEKFVKLNLKELLKLKSIYAIRFYIVARIYKNIKQIKFSINELHRKLKTPKSYHRDFRNFRLKVLEIAQKEINEKTDIQIDFEFITKGRKVTDVILKIRESELIENKKQPHKAVDNFNKFRQNLIKSNVIITLKDKYYEIKDGYLWQDDKLLSKEEAFEAWQELYKNKNKIKIIEDRQQFEAEREANRKEQLKQELLKEFFGKKFEYYTKNAFGGDELLYYEILKIEDITFKEDGTIDLIIFIGEGEDGKHYRLKATLNQLRQYTR